MPGVVVLGGATRSNGTRAPSRSAARSKGTSVADCSLIGQHHIQLDTGGLFGEDLQIRMWREPRVSTVAAPILSTMTLSAWGGTPPLGSPGSSDAGSRWRTTTLAPTRSLRLVDRCHCGLAGGGLGGLMVRPTIRPWTASTSVWPDGHGGPRGRTVRKHLRDEPKGSSALGSTPAPGAQQCGDMVQPAYQVSGLLPHGRDEQVPQCVPVSSPPPVNLCCRTLLHVRPQGHLRTGSKRHPQSPGGMIPNSSRNRPLLPPSSDTPTMAVMLSLMPRRAQRLTESPVTSAEGDDALTTGPGANPGEAAHPLLPPRVAVHHQCLNAVSSPVEPPRCSAMATLRCLPPVQPIAMVT